ncbi:MAG TPA: hypothetical protein VGF54_21775 [Streptosporangiaceae bacterium]
MGGGFLHVPQRHPGIQCCGDERVPQRVRPGRLGDTGAADPADDPPGAVPVQPAAIGGQEDRPLHALTTARSIARAVPALDTQGLDVGAGGFGHAQPVERQQRDQRVLGG